MRKRLIRWCIGVGLIGGGVFILTGRWTDPWLWSYVGVWAVMSAYAMFILDDDLARERFNPPEPGADRLSLRAVRLIALSHLVVGALDYGRWHLTRVPDPLRIVGLVGMVLSFGSSSTRCQSTGSSRWFACRRIAAITSSIASHAIIRHQDARARSSAPFRLSSDRG